MKMGTLLSFLALLGGGFALFRVRDRLPTPDITSKVNAIKEVPLVSVPPAEKIPPPRVPPSPAPVGGTGPRGIRNNNPGNIEYSVLNAWMGQTGSDGRFAVFSSPVYGIRALAKLILNYQRLYGLDTIRKIMTRWAPGHENPTNNYVAYVARQVGISPDEPIKLVKGSELFTRMITAIISFENGQQPYARSLIVQAINMA